MNRFFAMMRYNKQLLIVFIGFCVSIAVLLGLGIFDIVQLVQINKNAVSLSANFVTVNIVLISLVSVVLILNIVMFVTLKLKEKKQ